MWITFETDVTMAGAGIRLVRLGQRTTKSSAAGHAALSATEVPAPNHVKA
jgi:hypothetical protein